MSSEKLADKWAGFYHTAFAGGALVLAAGRPLKIGYSTYEDLHEYADKVASEALTIAVRIAHDVRDDPPVPPVTDAFGDDVSF